jgi:hypothetical protein
MLKFNQLQHRGFGNAHAFPTTAMLRTNSFRIMIVSVACAAGLVAQDSQVAPGAPVGGNDVAVADQGGGGADPAQRPQFNDPPPPPPGMNQPGMNQPGMNQPGMNPAPAGNGSIPASLTLPSGAFMTVRINQWLSSDRNKTGDTFYATLVQPLIVGGVVVAPRGASVMGQVSDVKKSHTDSNSLLALQLTGLTLIDGQQLPIQSQVMQRNGTTTPTGQQVGTVATGTAVGAGIGAIAGGGVGAAVGAGIGAIASSAGVVATRGRPTEVYPETMMTFRLDAPVTISTAQSSGAFHFASQGDYGVNPQARMAQGPPRPMGGPMGPGYGYGPAPYPAPYPYYGPYYYGPGFGVVIGPGYYGGFRGYRRF